MLAVLLMAPVAGLLGESTPSARERGEPRTFEALEQRGQEIRNELRKLSLENMVGGIGSVGFESQLHSSPKKNEWVQVDWGRPVPIDQVVLAPLLWQLGRLGYTAGGFPEQFRVLAGTAEDQVGKVIASFQDKDKFLPRSAPLVIPCETTASWVRVEASLLSKRIQDQQYSLQFSEILVFSGQDNVALNAAVSSSSAGNLEGTRRFRKALTDGYLPYEMNVPGDKNSFAFLYMSKPDERFSLLIDLGESMPINQINLFAIDSSSTSPRDFAGDYGIPLHFVIEGANHPDFSDAVVLVDREKKNSLDAGQILMLRFPESRQRYIRLISLRHHNNNNVVGFAEMEVFSNGRNVALGKLAGATGDAVKRRIESLTDGHNLNGRILSIKQWLGELAHRHDLEAEMPRINQAIQARLAQQKRHLAFLGRTTLLALAGAAIAVLLLQLLKMRQIAELRVRFAADLHDELGANLHSIGLLAEMAREDLRSPEKLEGTVEEIKNLVASTSAAARYCIEKQTHPLNHNLPEDMRNISRRILADIDWELDIQGGEHLRGLKVTFLDDLFLFYKECLVNICRHSMATRVRASLRADARRIELQVEDNGKGLDGRAPKSLQRRAHLLGGRVSAQQGDAGGSSIRLVLRRPRTLIFSKAKKTTP
jgi:signal transduction histidine kinase